MLMDSSSMEMKLASLGAELIGILPIAFTLHWLCKLKRPGLAWGLLVLLLIRGALLMYVMMEKIGPKGMHMLRQRLG